MTDKFVIPDVLLEQIQLYIDGKSTKLYEIEETNYYHDALFSYDKGISFKYMCNGAILIKCHFGIVYSLFNQKPLIHIKVDKIGNISYYLTKEELLRIKEPFDVKLIDKFMKKFAENEKEDNKRIVQEERKAARKALSKLIDLGD